MATILNSLQVGRALAALAVVAHHAALSTEAFVAPLPGAVREVLERGYLGVDFFFVLSGFIIYYTTANLPREPAGAIPFLRKRLRRIFVPYLPIGLIVAAAYLAVPSLTQGAREWGLLSTVTLIPTSLPPALSVAWTLQHELVFYALFAVLLATNRVALGMAFWAITIVVAWAMGLSDMPIWNYLLSPINLEFGLGVLSAVAVLRVDRHGRLFTLGAVAVFAAFLTLGAHREHSLLFGLAVALAIVPLCRLELGGKAAFPAWAVLLGNASYAIYLIHNPLLSVISRAASALDATWWVSIAASLVVSVAAGTIYHVLYEKPAMWLVRLGRKQPLPAAP